MENIQCLRVPHFLIHPSVHGRGEGVVALLHAAMIGQYIYAFKTMSSDTVCVLP